MLHAHAIVCILQITMLELGTMFSSARSVMGWLNACAGVIARGHSPKTPHGQKKDHSKVVKPAHVTWTNPMGLPVLQPYSTRASLQLCCVMQSSCAWHMLLVLASHAWDVVMP